MNELPAPLVPADVDLRSYDWFPFFHKRLRHSAFWKRASDLACRISVDFWSEAYEQVPAGSIPDDDHILADWAGFGRRDISGWLAVKDEVLGAWTLCYDGRWYHPTLSEVACQAWVKRRVELWERECDRIRKANGRRAKDGLAALPLPPKPTDDADESSTEAAISDGKSDEAIADPADINRTSGGIPQDVQRSSGGQGRKSNGKRSERDRDSKIFFLTSFERRVRARRAAGRATRQAASSPKAVQAKGIMARLRRLVRRLPAQGRPRRGGAGIRPGLRLRRGDARRALRGERRVHRDQAEGTGLVQSGDVAERQALARSAGRGERRQCQSIPSIIGATLRPWWRHPGALQHDPQRLEPWPVALGLGAEAVRARLPRAARDHGAHHGGRMTIAPDRAVGALLGLAVGDALELA